MKRRRANRKGAAARHALQIESTYKAEIISVSECLSAKYKEDPFLDIVKSHETIDSTRIEYFK
jgi:hypothetical protein